MAGHILIYIHVPSEGKSNEKKLVVQENGMFYCINKQIVIIVVDASPRRAVPSINTFIFPSLNISILKKSRLLYQRATGTFIISVGKENYRCRSERRLRLVSQLCHDELTVQAGDVGDRLVLRTYCLASAGVGTVTEAKLIHLRNHVFSAFSSLWTSLWEESKL